jgi:hypothetical protein
MQDLDGRLAPFMDAQGWAAMVIRPDFYVYGGCGSVDDLPALAEDLITDLRAAGVDLEAIGEARASGTAATRAGAPVSASAPV